MLQRSTIAETLQENSTNLLQEQDSIFTQIKGASTMPDTGVNSYQTLEPSSVHLKSKYRPRNATNSRTLHEVSSMKY